MRTQRHAVLGASDIIVGTSMASASRRGRTSGRCVICVRACVSACVCVCVCVSLHFCQFWNGLTAYDAEATRRVAAILRFFSAPFLGTLASLCMNELCRRRDLCSAFVPVSFMFCLCLHVDVLVP